MPTHAEVIARNPLVAPAPFWDNVYYAAHGFGAFIVTFAALGGFVWCCSSAITKVQALEAPAVERSAPETSTARRRAAGQGED